MTETGDRKKKAPPLDRDPFPGASFRAHGETVKLWRAALVPAAAARGTPGTVLAVGREGVVVQCGEGALTLLEVQRPGGKRQPVEAWLQGRPVAAGESLG